MNTYWYHTHFQFHLHSSTLKEREALFNNALYIKFRDVETHPAWLISFSPDLEVYYSSQSIANLLSMSVVTSQYCVTMDSWVKDAIIVHLENNQEIKFTRCGNGLYYFDTSSARPLDIPQYKNTIDKTIYKSKNSIIAYLFVSNVATNKEYFT